MSLTAEGDNKTILVVVCRNPSQAYCSKDQKHIGFLREGKIVIEKDAPSITEKDHTMIFRAFQALTVALINVHETP